MKLGEVGEVEGIKSRLDIKGTGTFSVNIGLVESPFQHTCL
jgi:hypothetical protein